MANPSAPPARSFAFPRLMGAEFADGDVCYVIVGATGWLGQATLEMLYSEFGPQATDRIIAFGSRGRDIKLRSGHNVRIHALESLDNLDDHKRYVFLHYAFLTRDKVTIYSHRDFVEQNVIITDAVSRAVAARKTIGLFVLSSGAVYRKDGQPDEDIIGNPYGVLKLRDETCFTKLAAQQGIPLAIMRVFNLAGPYINKVNTYALSSIILDVLRGGPVKLQASHPVIRSYASVFDVIDLGLCTLSDREQPNAKPFDTSGDHEIELGDLAKLCAAVLGRSDILIERPQLRDEPPDRYVGDGKAMRASAARYGIKLASLPDQIRATADFLHETLNRSI